MPSNRRHSISALHATPQFDCHRLICISSRPKWNAIEMSTTNHIPSSIYRLTSSDVTRSSHVTSERPMAVESPRWDLDPVRDCITNWHVGLLLSGRTRPMFQCIRRIPADGAPLADATPSPALPIFSPFFTASRVQLVTTFAAPWNKHGVEFIWNEKSINFRLGWHQQHSQKFLNRRTRYGCSNTPSCAI